MFPCLPPQGKCEWRHLQGFMQRFNALYGKSYTRSQCLDVEIRDSPQPELLLEAPGERPIVVEHKSVVWPRQILAAHSNGHHFGDHVLDLLRDAFNDSTYELTVLDESLHGKSKKEVAQIGDQIADTILSNQSAAKLPSGIAGKLPIRWGFRPVLHFENDPAYPKSGVVVIFWGRFQAFWSPVDDTESVAAKNGFADEFLRSANAAVGKFAAYGHCLKLLLVQFYGDNWLVSDDDIVEIIQSANLPEAIDQVWLGLPAWISDDDCVADWNLIRGINPY